MRPRYSITDYSLANALGHSTAAVLSNVFAGVHRFAPPSAAFPIGFATVVGEMRDLPEVTEFNVDQNFYVRNTRILRIAMVGARQVYANVARAVAKRGRHRVGLVVGTCTGGIDTTERATGELGALPAHYSADAQHPLHIVLRPLTTYFGLAGPTSLISTACSSSAKAVGMAHRWLEAGLVDAVVVAGVESLSMTTLAGFHALGALSAFPARPFAADRDGISLGEGCGFVLLERDGDAAVYSAGVGESSDAHHLTAPDPSGRGILHAMQSALTHAGYSAAQVDHINAHGTGTEQNDAAESAAIHALCTQSTPVTSTKSVTGHLLGAAGVTELVVAAESIVRGTVPPTAGSLHSDPALSIHVVHSPMPHAMRCVLSNSLGFGGSNASILLVS